MVQCWLNGISFGTFILPSPTLTLPSSSSCTLPLSVSALCPLPSDHLLISSYLPSLEDLLQSYDDIALALISFLWLQTHTSCCLDFFFWISIKYFKLNISKLQLMNNLFLCSWFKDTIAQSLKCMETCELLRLGCLIMSPWADFDFIVLGLASE